MFADFNFNDFMVKLALSIVPFFFAVTIHEVMHGYAAYKLGDNTAKNAGRITLNPIAHLDPIGLLILVLTQMIGWAKPVPVNYNNLRHKYGVAIVSVAGPLANLVTAFLSVFILILFVTYVANKIPAYIATPLEMMITYSISINVSLFIFNLLPIMPMDGARIIWNFLPREQAEKYEATGQYYLIIIFVLIVSGALSYIITPIRIFIYNIFNTIVSIIFGI